MRTRILALTAGLVSLAISLSGHAQTLTCQAGATAPDSACTTFHYHVQIWRLDTKTFWEVYGTPQFATMDACVKARVARQVANQQIVDYFKLLKKENAFVASRFGPCHCDLTIERSSPNYLDDMRRALQQRAMADALGRQRERLLDLGLESSSPLVRGLFAPPMGASIFEGKRLVAMPKAAQAGAAPSVVLKDTAIGSDTGPSVTAEISLPLAALEPGKAPITVIAPPAEPAKPAEEPKPVIMSPSAASIRQSPESEAPAGDEEDLAFVNYEMARVQQILAANSAVTDDDVKSKVIESCMQRLQLLSNLKSIAEGAGRKSRLATSLRMTKDEPSRLGLVSKLFGSVVTPHWAPTDAKDVVLQFREEIALDPVAVLHDSAGRFSTADRQAALYLLLARNPSLTASEDVWLSEIIESLLAG